MSTEKERWAKLAGLPEPIDKQQLDENFVGMGMVGNIFDREKEQYEDAFEYFLAEKYDRFYEGDTYSITIDHPDAGIIFDELGFDYQGRAQRDGNSYIFELPEDLELFKSETEHIREGLEENYTTEVRDAWPSLSIDDRVNLLLTVFDDPDMAEEMAEKDFNELPEAATSNMRMDMLEEGELNDEGKTSLASKIKNMIEVELMDLPITDEVVEDISNKIYREIKAILNF